MATKTAAPGLVHPTLPVDGITVEKGFNNRRQLGDVSELAASIKSVGLLQPLIVRRDGDAHVLVAGHRRLAACQSIGLERVPVTLLDADEAGRLEALLVENLHRQDLDPLEEADGYQRLVGLGLSQRQVADKVGRSQAHISKRLVLLALPDEVHKLLGEKDGLTLSDALELAGHEAEAIEIVLKDFKSVRRDKWMRQQWTAGRVARQAAEELARRRKVAAAEEQLAKLGVPPVKKDAYGFVPYGVLTRLGKGYGEIPIKVAEHRKLPCHAGYVDNHGGVHEGCIRPAEHTKSDDAAVAKAARAFIRTHGSSSGDRAEDSKKKAAETRGRNKVLRERQPVRAEAIKAAFGSRQLKDDILEFALRQLIQTTVHHARGAERMAADLLEVPTTGTAQQPAWGEYLSGGSDRLLKVAYALALSLGEEPIGLLPKRGYFDQEFQTHAERLMEHLRGHGYKPDAVELDVVKRSPNGYGYGAPFEKGWKRTSTAPEAGTLMDVLGAAAEEPAEPTISSPESSTGSDGSEAVSGVELAEASPAAAPAVPDSSAASNGHTPRRRKAATAVCRQCGRGEKGGVVFVELVDAGPLCDECSTSRPAPPSRPSAVSA